MSKRDASRRNFLARAGVGAGALACAGLVPGVLAQNHERDKKATGESKPAANDPAQSHSNSDAHGAFFNREQAAAISVFTERLMPGAPGKPGALDAAVLNYIDLALAGWRLVGFPGAQAIFTHADMQSKQAFTRVPIAGLQARAKKA